ncbi:U6 snRNA-associated Sm-like protein LSm7, partial [Cryphonectria parasitica EP155]
GRGGGQHHREQGHGEGGSGSGSKGDRAAFKKENILDLNKYLDQEIRVKFTGGREAIGTLKGFDQLMNLVLDDVRETMRDDDGNVTTRPLGLAVFRGTVIALIHPMSGSEEIKNPFVADDE